MYKIIFISILSLIIFSCTNKKIETKPNIVVILSDDQGWGDLSISGNTNISTPNIDKLAETGVIFDNFYVCAVCSPTRAELLTGRYHSRGGVYSTSSGGERLDLDETTIAEVFKNAGYATAAYGKWHNGMQPPYHPNARGFDDFYGFCSGHWGNYFSPMLEHNGEIVKGNGFIIDDLTDHGIDFIEKNNPEKSGKPFFLYLPFNTPHAPMQVPEKWWNKFKDKKLEMRNRKPLLENIEFTKAALAMCENIDWNVGRITAKIEELHLTENTIIIYLSDNGPNSWRWNGGMKGRKGSTDEGGVRSPMFLNWKGKIAGGQNVTQIAGAIDLLPTLADLAGINKSNTKPLDGVSLKPLLFNKNAKWKERFILNSWKQKVSVRSQEFRLGAKNQLFDMDKDHGQTKDVSTDFPAMYSKLLDAKNKFEKEVIAELPETDKRTFPIGDPNFNFTQIPARDGIAHGNIKRSNHFPNCTFFTNWISTTDSITWNAEVLADGDFEVEVYYTCPAENIGTVLQLSFNNAKITGKITTENNPPLKGMENDRYLRTESYVKDFIPTKLGTIHLKKGTGTLTLTAPEIPGKQAIDFRLLMLKRI